MERCLVAEVKGHAFPVALCKGLIADDPLPFPAVISPATEAAFRSAVITAQLQGTQAEDRGIHQRLKSLLGLLLPSLRTHPSCRYEVTDQQTAAIKGPAALTKKSSRIKPRPRCPAPIPREPLCPRLTGDWLCDPSRSAGRLYADLPVCRVKVGESGNATVPWRMDLWQTAHRAPGYSW
ncbi:hypothetical protein SKAU_G00424910 [Synaphobranchus kaupii]|uniref:Uncharacterized protein n=1 Tax=Synaphobranchus kaupii TaxID=118154 RepID=A0A9Q1IAP4_SYNKA|nr:hypothetical protein SKAU_G00424910 [Synaphobranchus kaupii]